MASGAGGVAGFQQAVADSGLHQAQAQYLIDQYLTIEERAGRAREWLLEEVEWFQGYGQTLRFMQVIRPDMYARSESAFVYEEAVTRLAVEQGLLGEEQGSSSDDEMEEGEDDVSEITFE